MIDSLALPSDELVVRIRTGEAEAFAALMQRYNRRLFRIARSILKDDAEAEEAVQETYIRAFTSFDTFLGQADLSTWLARITINEAVGRIRRRRPTMDLDEMGDELLARTSPSLSPERAVARGEVRAFIEQAVDDLPQAFRTVFVLRAIEQMPVEEVALALDIPKQTVKTRFFRARRLLRIALEAELGAMLQDAFPFAGTRCEHLTGAVLGRLGLSISIETEPDELNTANLT